MIRMKSGSQNRRTFIKIDKLDKDLKRAIHGALCEIGQSHVVHCRVLLRKIKTGIHHPGLPNRSSAPGEPPATQSGELSRHVRYVASGHDQMEFGDKSQQGKFPYGRRLELEMNRPHISQTVRDEYKNTFTSLENSMNRALE